MEGSENYPRPKEEEGGTSDQKRGRCAVSLKSPLFFPPHPERTMPQEQCHTSHTAATRLRLERPLTREPRQQCLNAASPLAAPGVWGLKWKVLEPACWAVRGPHGAAAAFRELTRVAPQCVHLGVHNLIAGSGLHSPQRAPGWGRQEWSHGCGNSSKANRLSACGLHSLHIPRIDSFVWSRLEGGQLVCAGPPSTHPHSLKANPKGQKTFPIIPPISENIGKSIDWLAEVTGLTMN